MFKSKIMPFVLGLAACAAMPNVASADVIPISRQIELTFTGTVTQSAGDTLVVTDANGNTMPFEGDLSDYPVQVGDPFTYSYGATIPTQAYFDTLGIPVGDDGLFRVQIVSTQVSGGGRPGSVGDLGSISISDDIFRGSQTVTGAEPGIFHTLAIDPATNEVFIDHEAGFQNGPYRGPFLVFNNETGQYELCGNCLETIFQNTGNIPDPLEFRLAGNDAGTELTFSSLVPTTMDGLLGIPGSGTFSIIYGGTWNFPSLSSRGTTPVPAPGMLLLFGLGAAAVFGRKQLQARISQDRSGA